MNESKAKAIRKAIYGDDFSPRFRKYTRLKDSFTLVADQKRREYQSMKKRSK
jgi:hypothetical protein